MRNTMTLGIAVLAAFSLLVGGCGGEDDTADDSATATEGAEVSGEEAGEEGGEAAEEGGETAEEGGEAAEEGGEAAEEGGEAGEEGGETAEEGGEGEEGGSSAAEDCVNGSDDDADGLVDCEDPECAGKPACSEADCSNGEDDDNDGLIDCDDDECEWSDACQVESCSTFYVCLAELGCDCELGVDCPFDVGDDAYYQCQTTCYQNETCSGQCVASLSIEVQDELAAYQNCTSTFCANATTDEEYSDCIYTSCVSEYANCFFYGEESCAYYYWECTPACADGDSDCTGKCADELSPDGFASAIGWDNCRFDLGNQDGDSNMDSNAAYYLASFYACQGEAGTCLDGVIGSNEEVEIGTCGDVVACVTACESLGDGDCVIPCLDIADPAAPEAITDLFTCALSYCGTQEDALVPACLEEAFGAEDGCLTEATTCGVADEPLTEGGEATEEGGEATEEGGEATEEGGEATEEGGEATEEGGEATEEGGEATEEGGEATEEGGEATEEGGEATEEGGEATEEGGEATEEGGEATEEGGEAVAATFCEEWTATCGDWMGDTSCADWWAAADPGTEGDTAGATQACYWYHLGVAQSMETPEDVALHCGHAMGEAPCVNP